MTENHPPEKEQLEPERQIIELVTLAENELSDLYQIPPRESSQRLQWCETACWEVEAAAIRLGMEARRYNTADLHEVAVQKALERGASEEIIPNMFDLFGHFFDVVEVRGSIFLVDLTFGQFCGDDGKLMSGITQQRSENSNDHPLVQQLLTHGFAPLGPETFREYMKLTTAQSNLQYGGFLKRDLLAAQDIRSS